MPQFNLCTKTHFMHICYHVFSENESVVAELLRNAKGGLELVDAREFLPLFKCRPGLTDWYVMDDFYAIKKEVRERKFKAKKQQHQEQQGEQGQQASSAAEGAAAPDTEMTEATEGDVAVGQEEKEGEEEGQSSAASTKEDFSHIEDPALRKCLEVGMTHFPDFASVPASLDRKIRKSMFPPTAEEKEWMHLGKYNIFLSK